MDKQLLKNMKGYIDAKGAVWELDLMNKFMVNDTLEERNKVHKAMIILINKGDITCNPLRPVAMVCSSQRCLH